MRKLFILLASLVLVLGLSGCDLLGEGDIDKIIDSIDSVELNGLADETIMVDDVFDVFAKATATGSDLVDYTPLITASSDNCTINADGTLDTGIPAECIIEYSVVALGKLARTQITVTIEAPVVVVDPDAALVKGWTFDNDDALVGWTKYEAGGGSVTESIEDGALKLEIISGGLIYESRFEFMGVPLQNETDYSVSFRAKSSEAGKILHFQMGELLPSDPWFTDFKPGVTNDFVLTTEWADYTFTFTMGIDNVNGGPLFEMGDMEGSMGIDGTIWVDDLTISGGSATDETAPAFTGVEAVTTYLGDVFDPMAGVVANDFVDGVVTDDVVVSGETVDVNTAGTYTITYTVSDAAMNENSVDRVVTVEADTMAPVITGIDNAVVALGSTFDVLEGVMAMDNRDGDVTSAIVVGGDTVDVETAGEYSVTYTVEDALENTVTETRVVIVNAMLWDETDLVVNGKFDVNPWYVWQGNWTGVGTEATPNFNESEVVIDIVNPGAQNWNVQLVQEGLTFVENQEYTVTFDALSTVARDITFKVIAADNTEFAQTFSIVETVDTYTFNFVFNLVDQAGKISIELGGVLEEDELNPVNPIDVAPPSVVTFDNVMLETSTAGVVDADTDQVVNGDFALSNLTGWASWSRDWDPIVTSTLKEEWNEGVFTYDGIGDDTWQAKVEQGGFVFEFGKTYRLTFDAKGSADRDFHASFYDGAVDFRSPALALTTEFASYEYIFTWDSTAGGLLQFELGKYGDAAGGIFYVDNVMIESLQQEELLVNGDLEATGWGAFVDYWWWSGAASEVYFNNVDGEVEVDIVEPGGAAWAIQLNQVIELEVGKQYRVTFEAYADEARTISALVGYQQASDNSWHEYGSIMDLALTTTKTSFTYDIDVTEYNDIDNMEIKFECGGNAVNFYVDNVTLEELDELSVVIADSDLVVNGTFDQLVDWNVWMSDWNFANATSTNGMIELDITNVGTDNWNIQLYQEGIALVKGVTYTVVFDAMSTVERDINVKMIGAVEYTGNISLTTEMATYSFTFVYGEDDADNKLDFELGGAMNGIVVSVPSVITFDNIYVFPNYNPQD